LVGRDRIAAGELIDAGLGPLLALFRLGHPDEASAVEHRDLREVALVPRSGERVHRRGPGVVPHDFGHDLLQLALAIAAGSINEQEDLLSFVAPVRQYPKNCCMNRLRAASPAVAWSRKAVKCGLGVPACAGATDVVLETISLGSDRSSSPARRST